MTLRPTQLPSYWVESFQVTQFDIDHLYNVLLEKETPLNVDEMALILVRHRISDENETTTKITGPDNAYRPANHYNVEDELILTEFGNRLAKVLAVRDGTNPDYGRYSVISVAIDDKIIEFAADFPGEHVLNEKSISEIVNDASQLSPEELFIEFGGEVSNALQERLAGQDDIVKLAGRWFPRSLLADVTMGHLNLAEAVLDMNSGGPLETRVIVEQIGIMSDFNVRLAEFSLNYGLQRDERFDEVGPAGKVLWFLRRLEPIEVQTTPPNLVFTPIDYDLTLLSPELIQLEQEIGDEHSPIAPPRGRPQSATLLLNYAHRRAGTLPLSHQLRQMFPTAYEAPRIRFMLVDGVSGEEIPAWVVRPGGYVYGLSHWFADHDVPVGGYLTVTRTDDPSRVTISYAGRKPRIEWIRTAQVRDNRLLFENRKLAVGCDFDDLMVIDVEDPDGMDSLAKYYRDRRISLDTIVQDVCRELSKLSQQDSAHAKTIYSAANLLRRCPPGPIFAMLSISPRFESVGGPYWRVSENSHNA